MVAFETWLQEQGFTDGSISKLLKEEFKEASELADLDKHDIESLHLKLAQRKLLEKVITSLNKPSEEKKSQEKEANPVTTKDLAENTELNQTIGGHRQLNVNRPTQQRRESTAQPRQLGRQRNLHQIPKPSRLQLHQLQVRSCVYALPRITP